MPEKHLSRTEDDAAPRFKIAGSLGNLALAYSEAGGEERDLLPNTSPLREGNDYDTYFLHPLDPTGQLVMPRYAYYGHDAFPAD